MNKLTLALPAVALAFLSIALLASGYVYVAPPALGSTYTTYTGTSITTVGLPGSTVTVPITAVSYTSTTARLHVPAAWITSTVVVPITYTTLLTVVSTVVHTRVVVVSTTVLGPAVTTTVTSTVYTYTTVTG